MKFCTTCGIEKELSEFSKRSASKDGTQARCKECHSVYGKNNKDKVAEYSRTYRLKNPEKKYAHMQMSYAIKKGRLIKPDHCEMCFNEREVEGHHEDYNRPLDVEWLCKKCHLEVHRETCNVGLV